jgi:LysM repeat protein
MTDKNKTRGKPTTAAPQRKERTSVDKADHAVKVVKKELDKAYKAFTDAEGKAIRSYQTANQYKKGSSTYNKYMRISRNWQKATDANKKKYNRLKKQYKDKKAKLDKLTKQKDNMNAINNTIAEHNAGWHNEGNMALFRTDGVGGVIFFAPINTESESNSTNVTSYPVDKGAPRSSYARVSSKSISLDGLITGHDRAEANQKWRQLRSWHSNHNELTFKGDIYYKHFIMTELDRSYTNLEDNIQVSMTLTFVRAAEITTSKGKTSKKKSSKSSKTTAGNRHKNYTTITIKSGDTLYQLSKKYGKSVKWLAKVNKIKDVNRIYAGRKLRVK